MNAAVTASPQATYVFPAEANPLAFIRLNADNTVTVISKHMEMGQGIYTGLVTLVADEIDAAPAQMRVEPAPHNPALYGNPLMGGGQGTGGQTSTQASYMAMRMAGAAMRRMIITAAAARWGVEASTLRIAQGLVHGAAGRMLSFGELASDAMAQAVPTDAAPKQPTDFTYIGKHFDRIDIGDKARGKSIFAQDLKLPGMLTAVIARPTRHGAKLIRFDAAETLRFTGVTQVVQVPTGVAVVATNFWSAYEGSKLLKIEWDNSQAWRASSADISAQYKALLDQPGMPSIKAGDVDTALATAAKRVSADYEVPFHAQAPLETVSVVMQVQGEHIDVWGGIQTPMTDIPYLAQAAGIPAANVSLHMMITGGSFGRYSHPSATPTLEVFAIIKALGTDQPIKLTYSREDEFSSTSTPMRPAYMHRIEGGLDSAGNVVAWKHRIVGQSILTGTPLEQAMVRDGIDFMSVESSVDAPYVIPNVALELHTPVLPVMGTWMRSTGSFHNCFANESMVDELALAAGIEPLAMRRKLIPEGTRERGCLELVVDKAGWAQPLAGGPAGSRRGRGLAAGPAHRSYGAVVIEVTVTADHNFSIDRVVCAQDSGLVINPDNLRSQIEGAVGFGLAMARYMKISFKDGEIEQKFYSDHHITRMHTMPKVIDVHLVDSPEGPSGAGETISALIAPALANALADATGIRVRSVPIRLPDEPPEEHWDVPAVLNTFRGAPVTDNR